MGHRPFRACALILNRLFFPPFGIDTANEDGTISDSLEKFYLDIAKGGCGLVILSNATVSPNSLLGNHGLRMYHDSHAKSLKKLVKRMKQYNVVPGLQLNHYGRQGVTTYTGKEVIGPSAIPCKSTSKRDSNYKIREMTIEDIERVKNDFVNAAQLCYDAGLQYIQLHGANGYLLSSFLSPYTNKRTDQYGGSIENRTRFLVEIIRKIRTTIGDDIILSIRLNADDRLESEDGLKPAHLKTIIPMLESAGVDLITLSMTIAETAHTILPRNKENLEYVRNLVKEVKSYTKVPVGFAMFTESLETGEQLISQNITDLVGMGRALFADNDLIKKTIAGRENEINKCLWDSQCLKDKYNPDFDRVYCCVNPKYRRPGSIVPTFKEDRMKILVLNSSYRGKNGFTHKFTEKIFEGARSAKAECEELILKDYKINNCTGCKKCQTQEHHLKCIFHDKDDVDLIVGKIKKADLIIYSSPSYFHFISSVLKKLIERFYSYSNVYDSIISDAGLLIYNSDKNILGKPYVVMLCAENVENETLKNSISYFETLSKFYDGKKVGTLYRNGLFLSFSGENWEAQAPKMYDVYDAYRTAGIELATIGAISKKTEDKANQEIFPLPYFKFLKKSREFKEKWLEDMQENAK